MFFFPPAMVSQGRDGNMAQGEKAGYVQGETERAPNPSPRRRKVQKG